jgi:UTP--glucose-1-phosphate uridylyltransferase
MEICKLIVPAAGTGERFLPLSKSVPREMLPILRKPALQHIAEEAIASELSNLILISSQRKGMMFDHFNPHAFEMALKEADKSQHLEALEKVSRSLQITEISQYEPLGTAHAIWLARHSIHPKEYFAVAHPDDLIFGKQPALSQLIRIAHQEKASVIAVQEVPSECISSYGVIGIKKAFTPNLFQVSQVVEKPQPKDAPSSLAIVGRYVLSSKILSAIDEMVAYKQESLPLTDALTQLLHSGERVFAYKVQGTRYDIGSHLGWIKAIISTSLQDSELSVPLRKFLQDLDTPESFLYNPAKMIQDNL